MRLIDRKTLRTFYTRHPDSKEALEDWYEKIRHTSFKNFAEIRQLFPNADVVGKATVFNIKGNHYRLITAIHYSTQIVYVLEVMTHAQYSEETWKTRFHIYD